ncbi:TPA: site-specific DNA-methyltransferase [Yersinia enterocolitica]|uniref:site-specific DNA-methyltransferase n=2 Tax=Yersinia enterocolitica TaxID=630 RepID=UPI00376D9426
MSQMEKIMGTSPEAKSLDITSQNIEQLKQLFPDVFSEGKIDFEALKAVLGAEIDDSEERYNFTWNGKKKARQIAQTPSIGTLRPCKEESVNWDTTENLFIEGDNLEVLKLLQKSYHKKVKLVYIDPPYNTGKDFVYKDNFNDNIKNYLEITNQVDDAGNKLKTNTDASGRYHSDWLSMMYPRLKLARNLLRDDGVIFISIDENEVNNLRNICNEIFGEDNFIACIANINNPKGRSDDKYIARSHEYILCYKKQDILFYGWEPEENITKRYNKLDGKGKYRDIDLRKTGDNDRREDRPNLFYYFMHSEATGEIYPTYDDLAIEGFHQIKPTREDGSDGNWRWSLESAQKNIHLLQARYMGVRGKWTVSVKDYLTSDKRVKPTSSWTHKFANSERGTEQLVNLGFDKKLFPNPKPIGLLQAIMVMATSEDDIILDFFAGSGSTGHAMYEQNSKDNIQRKFILVQLPEPVVEGTIAENLGYKVIPDITKERLTKAGEMYKNNGFKVFKLDETNIRPWDADFSNLEKVLQQTTKSIKYGRSSEDVLYEIFLKYGYELTTPVEIKTVNGKTVLVVGAGALIVCLDDEITTETVEGITKLKSELDPETTQVVFKDEGFTDDRVKTNAIQILKQAGIEDVKSI